MNNWSKNPKIVILVASIICAGSLVLFYWLLVDVMGFNKSGIIAVISTTAVAVVPILFYSYGELNKKLATLKRHNHPLEADD